MSYIKDIAGQWMWTPSCDACGKEARLIEFQNFSYWYCDKCKEEVGGKNEKPKEEDKKAAANDAGAVDKWTYPLFIDDPRPQQPVNVGPVYMRTCGQCSLPFATTIPTEYVCCNQLRSS
jgi:ribosomal protein L37AE/L43A